MLRPPTKSTRSDTLFPNATLFLSDPNDAAAPPWWKAHHHSHTGTNPCKTGTRLARLPPYARTLLPSFSGLPDDQDRYPFRPLADRLPAYRRCPHGAVQLAVRAPSRRQLPAAQRGYRTRTAAPGSRRKELRGPTVARPEQ